MKRTVAIILLLIMISMLLVGCTPKFDMEKCITDLQSNGFVLEIENDNTTSSLTFDGKDFKVVGQRYLRLSSDRSKYVLVYIMESPESAEQVVSHTLAQRKENPVPTNVKIAYGGSCVIYCNHEPAMEIIGLKFEN